MNSLEAYFHTDWDAMTNSDWSGLVVTIIIFILMLVVYSYVLRPSNREKIEAKRLLPLDYDDQLHTEDKS